MPEFKKILVANRGEIAIRVMRAANELGKRTVAIYAEEDKLSLHRFKADEAYKIGEGLGPVAAYLRIDEIIRVAKDVRRRRDPPRLWPSVGEPRFRGCLRSGRYRLHRPKAETMRALGDKASARQVAIEAGVPVIPATEVLGDDMKAIAKEADEIGYPLMLKAVLGRRRARHAAHQRPGRAGGKGAGGPPRGRGRLRQWRGVSRKDDPARPPRGGADPRRQHGQYLSPLYERDCSVQRRNQKVVERAPAPYLSVTARGDLHAGQEDLRACELPMRRHGRIPDGYGHRRLLLHRGEPPRAGRAYRDRGGHRHRHRAGADPDYRGQVADRGHGHAVPV
jgi:pyruvate carboxylase